MKFEFRLPDVGEGLHEAELIEWTVKVGDRVAEGDEVASISTDKVNVELAAPYAGWITELCWKPGDIITVGEVLLRMELEGRAKEEKRQAPGTSAQSDDTAIASRPRRSASAKIKASPKVRREAARRNIGLKDLTPSGNHGQILMRDLERTTAHQSEAETEEDWFRLRGARLAAAERLETSSRTLATSGMTFKAHADAILERAGEAGVTPLAVIACCVAVALAANRRFNASVVEEEMALRLSRTIDLGIAVDTDQGLFVPVIRNFDDLDFPEAAKAIESAAEKARAGCLAAADLKGASFTLSSTGGLEKALIVGTAPVINYPNAAILWVSRITDQPCVLNGALELGPVMHCTLSFDHRFLHGADALKFINDLNSAFASPSLA